MRTAPCAPGRSPSKKVWLVALLVMLAVTAFGPSANAYYVCTETYVGECHNTTSCDYYDNDTGRYTGSINVHYHCSRVY
jgi:hypothetical protein